MSTYSSQKPELSQELNGWLAAMSVSKSLQRLVAAGIDFSDWTSVFRDETCRESARRRKLGSRSRSGNRRRFGHRDWAKASEALESRCLLSAITVTTRFDLVDPDDGVVSLREALTMAGDETAYPGPNTIQFDPSLGSGMIHADYGGFVPDVDPFDNNRPIMRAWFAPNSGGQFVVDSDVTIDGSALGIVRIGHERGWAEFHRIFYVNEGVTATFSNLVIQGGDSNNDHGGGIWNGGNLTLINSVVGSNYALGASGGALKGGGIYNAATGTLTLQRSHIGEVALDAQFLEGIGVAGDFFAEEEQSSYTQFVPFIYRGEGVVGKSTSNPTQISGNGAYGDGGGIYNDGVMHITDGSVIRGNRGENGRFGGGIYNAGLLFMSDSVVEDHVRYNSESQSAPTGAGIYNASTGTMQIERSIFRNNVTNRQGGAIYNAGVMTISESTFDGNSAIKNANETGLPSPEGGAIFDTGISTTIAASTFSGGTAWNGGGIVNFNNGDMVLERVTIANNSSPQGVGAGLYNAGGVTTVINSTIAWNSAMRAGGLRNGTTARTSLRNTIIGSNSSATTHADIQDTGTLISEGHNLIQSSGDFAFDEGIRPSDIVGVDPLLGRLSDVGGLTQTVGLLPGSPAIDSGYVPSTAEHDYQFQGTLQDQMGGPELIALGGTLNSDSYKFQEGQGLSLPTTTVTGDDYSIEMMFRIDSSIPDFIKLVDFNDLSTDAGLYVQDRRLLFYGGGIVATSTAEIIRPNTIHHLVLTRNIINQQVVAWVDGVNVFQFFDTNNLAVFDTTNGALQFFVDDTVTAGKEAASGEIFRLRIYPQDFAEHGIQRLPRSIFDQRGLAGMVGNKLDRGALESTPPDSMRVDSLEDVTDGNYTPGQFTLREAIEWANVLPGADQITFSSDLIEQLRQDPQLLTLAGSQLEITDDLSIYGPGAQLLTISGQDLSRHFYVAPGVNAEISGMTLTDGKGIGRGGAILSEGNLTLREMRITENQVIQGAGYTGRGGGVANYGTLRIDSSTIDHNTGPENGGGVYSLTNLVVVNSTISGNTSGFGGGIHVNTGVVTIESSTITRNHASVRGGGLRRFPNATTDVHNSIIAGNTSPLGPDGYEESNGTLTGSHNIIGIGDQFRFVDGVNNNRVGSVTTPLDPLLATLRNLGGPTPVHGLLPGSPALEHADAGNFPRFDQRGIARPVDVLPDAGAFEYIAPTLSNPIIVDSLDGDSDGAFGPGQMSLTEAILFTNADPSLNRIQFDPAMFSDGTKQKIPLDNTELVLTGNVTLVGPGADLLEVRGAGTGFGVFNNQALSTISGMTISGGDVYSGGPDNRIFGGGIQNLGNLTLSGVYVTDNRAQYGGGINNGRFSTLVINDSTIANNEAIGGGGLFTGGIATLTNVTVSGNSANYPTYGRCGGIWNDNGLTTTNGHALTLIHTTITNNSSVQGGGLFTDGEMAITSIGNTLIAGNTASDFAADIFHNEGTITSLGGNIIGDNETLTAALFGSDQFGTPSTPLQVLITGLVTVSDATMPVHALLPEPGGNKAVNRGVAANGVPTDQRGVARPYDGGYDVGAFEIGAIDYQAFTFENEIIVDNLSDELDGYYGPGGMTLREAVLITNAFNASSPTVIDGISYDKIRFSASLFEDLDGAPAEISLTRGGLEFYGDIIIETTSPNAGPCIAMPRVIVDANQSSRVMTFRSGVDARLSDLNLTGGVAAGTHQSFRAGGGIKTDGNLWLNRVDIYGNSAEYAGGGIYTGTSDVWIKDSRLYDNSAEYGGAVSIEQAHNLTMTRSSVFNNSATNRGGGLSVIGGLTLIDSAIYDNTATELAGGISSYSGDGIIRNTTISGNSAKFGGGMYRSVGVTLRIENSTIAANNATVHAGGIRAEGRIEFANTILAGNTAPQGPDALNTLQFISLGHNIFGNTSQFANPGGPFGGGSFVTGVADQLNVNPQLGPLLDNGGATLTHALKPDSPAIDRGSEMYMPLMDQRGFPLVDIMNVGTTIPDIGAYEVQSVSSSTWRYEALNRSQFGPGDALVYGFGFDEGKVGSKVSTDPKFLGFQFDTGRMTFGKIEDGPGDTKFGADLTADFAGKFGFDVGFYVNSGSVDVTYDGDVNYLIDADPSGQTSSVTAFVGIDDGSLYTISPKIGAYLDLILKLDAEISARAALFGVVGFDLLDIEFDEKIELFSLNRQMSDDFGRPLFLDRSGEAVARDSRTRRFYSLDVSPREIADPGPVVPLFDGDIRYFSLPIQEVADGIRKAAQKAREKVKEVQEGRKAAKELDEARKEVTKSENEIQQKEDRLAKAIEQDKRATSLKAQQEIVSLAGPEYAAAVAQGKKGDELPEKKGSIEEANKKLVDAKRKQADAEEKVKKKKNQKKSTNSKGIVLQFGEAEGSLLGAELKVGVGASAGPFSLTRNVGTLQVTLPDVNLRSDSANEFGILSATTDAFPANSELDQKRQIAKAQLDVAPLLPIPGIGRFNVSMGPLSLDLTTVSYNVGPQLNVVQDVQARPVRQDQALSYSFFDAADPAMPVSVQVKINGQSWMNGAFVQSVTLNEGDRLEVVGQDLDGIAGNDPILVMPELTMGSEFSNDIGLDVELDGALEAFALKLSAFGESVIDVKPLIKRNHTIASAKLGSVFNNTFSLGTQTIALEPFTLFDASSRGRTAGKAIQADPAATANTATVSLPAMGPIPLFVAAPLLNQTNADTGYQTLEVQRLSGPQISSVEVLDERLSVSGGTNNQPFQITGFTADMMKQQPTALFALRFDSNGTAAVQITGQNPVSLSAAEPQFGSDSKVISDGDFQRAGVQAILNNDIDGDGFSLPDTDGKLMIRYLAGFSGEALVAGILNENSTRTDPAEIAAYIGNLLDQKLPSEQFGNTTTTLDFDGDGGSATALGDGILLTRYLAGTRGSALTSGVISGQSSRTTGEEIVAFIEYGRASASDPAATEFTKAQARNGTDVFGLNGTQDADPNAVQGSSATAAFTSSGFNGGSGSSGNGSNQPAYSFSLTTYGQTVQFEELYINSISPQNRVSRIAEGSPTEFGNEERSQLINSGGSDVNLIQQTVSATLGIDEPVFVKAPDAAGYEYVAGNGYAFTSLTIDPRIGGNLLQKAAFDLYLYDAVSQTWKFDRLITDANPDMVLPNGNLQFDFAGTPTERFRLYSLSLPNDELHSNKNTAAPILEISTGFTLQTTTTVSSTPEITLIQLAPRDKFGDAVSMTVMSPALISDTTAVTSLFTVSRDLHEAVLSAATSGRGVLP